MLSVRLNISVPLLTTLPPMLPVVVPLPMRSVPLPICVVAACTSPSAKIHWPVLVLSASCPLAVTGPYSAMLSRAEIVILLPLNAALASNVPPLAASCRLLVPVLIADTGSVNAPPAVRLTAPFVLLFSAETRRSPAARNATLDPVAAIGP